MDSRHTLQTNETFLAMLTESFATGQKLALLIEEEGITRTEGYITALNKESANPYFVLNGDQTILVSQVIAVNGVFRPEYGEC